MRRPRQAPEGMASQGIQRRPSLGSIFAGFLERTNFRAVALVIGFAVLAAGAVYLVLTMRPKPKQTPDDLGQGIVAAEGMRGHLIARWDGKMQYKLTIEAMDPRYTAAFGYVAAHPAERYSLKVRLLDTSGFALCSKEILFPFSPVKPSREGTPAHASPRKAARLEAEQTARQAVYEKAQQQETQREQGADVLQRQLDADGKVVALSAQGVLPCSQDLYKRIYYWDLSSNFPTVAEQNAIMRAPAIAAAKRLEAEREAERRRWATLHPASFYAQGDETVTAFDASRGVLYSNGGNNFFVSGQAAQSVANFWATNSTLVHYKCDQHASCILTSAGGGASIRAQQSE
ncbi:MAG TPA: hypothetical protein VFI20_11605 [Terracidiphilus sp.]|nr:hypothetical protein [Terracidiphilus sp.]